MSGGGTMLIGIAFLLLFLVGIAAWGMWAGLMVLLKGGIPVLMVVLGAVLVWIGIMDLRAKKAETGK